MDYQSSPKTSINFLTKKSTQKTQVNFPTNNSSPLEVRKAHGLKLYPYTKKKKNLNLLTEVDDLILI
jgi:hypothetical protein